MKMGWFALTLKQECPVFARRTTFGEMNTWGAAPTDVHCSRLAAARSKFDQGHLAHWPDFGHACFKSFEVHS